MNQRETASLFEGWDEALILSCLQGHMGNMIVNDDNNPKSALIAIGDFCFLAGEPNENLLSSIKGFKLLVPRDAEWEAFIEGFFHKNVKRILRYAIKKEPNVFDKKKLISFVMELEDCYELKLFNKEIFEQAQNRRWSMDLCSQFRDFQDYQNRAIGVAILHDGKLVAGASTYAIYDDGIEIEIDTKPEYRRKGLATICGAKLILESLARGMYPSWDAHDLRSLSLAEKLGYHLSHPYVTYILTND